MLHSLPSIGYRTLAFRSQNVDENHGDGFVFTVSISTICFEGAKFRVFAYVILAFGLTAASSLPFLASLDFNRVRISTISM
jgi:hypothetical protein